MDSSAYITVVENVIAKFGGMHRICAITSDSAQCCVNAKNAVMRAYPKLVGVQDQAHVADLLMKDVGSVGWIKEVLEKVSFTSKCVRGKKKLLARFREKMEIFNTRIKTTASIVAQAAPKESAVSFLAAGAYPKLKKTCVMLRKPSRTRFGSHGSTLEAYLRARAVLLEVLACNDFAGPLFGCRIQAEQRKMKEEFQSVIESSDFFCQVQEIHNILYQTRGYLRKFDGEKGRIYDVVPETVQLQLSNHQLPLTEFHIEARRKEVEDFLQIRMSGPTVGNGGRIKINLLQDIHFVAMLLDPSQIPTNDGPFQDRLHRHIYSHANGPDSGASEQLREKLLVQYTEVRFMWTSARSSAEGRRFLYDLRNYPLLWWNRLAGKQEYAELYEFALRTLSASPSSCAAEQSLSMQKRIRTDSRNLITADKVRKLTFCHWNGRLSERSTSFSDPQTNFQRSVQKEIEGGRAEYDCDGRESGYEVAE